MAVPLTIATTVPARGQVFAAVLTALLLLAAAGAVLPYGATALPPNSGFMPAFGGMMFLGTLITAALLLSQGQATQNRSTADLGTAYLFSSMVIVPHLLAFPGVFAAAPIIGTSASAVWLWCIWHAGFGICVMRYAWRHGRAGAGSVRLLPIVATVAAIVLLMAWIATAGVEYLPVVIVGTGFSRLDTLGIGPAVLLCNLGALFLVVTRLRGRTVLDLWLAVATLTATLDVTLTIFGAGRFTLGWYAARLLSLATDVTVLVALLSELIRLFGRISALNAHLQTLSVTDGLTQIANRRGFDEALERAWRDAEREETAISLLMVDVDHFKGFNDAYGHPAGDECLRRIASLINGHARRPYDVAGRLGGEEFALLMPRTEEAGAAMIAARLRAGIESLMIPNAGSRLGHVTISGGIATLRPCAQRHSPDVLTDAADQALYRAKSAGRNRVAAFEGHAEPPSVAPLTIPARPATCEAGG
jgi:diguanylate cyclase (GGDEF)-like protein